MLEKLIEELMKRLKLSEEDAVVAAIFALGGFVIDAHFFPAGMPPGTVTVVFGASGFLLSKVAKNTRWYRRYIFGQLDRYGSELGAERVRDLKQKLLAKWLESSAGIEENER